MLHDEKRDSEQIRSAFSHSDDLRRLATFSTLQKNLLFTRSSKQGLGLSDPHLPPQAAQSPEIRFAGTSSSSSSVAVGSSKQQARGQVQGLATSRRVRSAPAGKLVQYNQHLGN